MKTILFFPMLLVTFFFGACHSDDNGTPQAISGEWKLTNVHGGIAGTDDDFVSGAITWNFSTSAHTVAVVNTNTDDSKQDFMPTGTYNYSFSPNDVTPQSCSTNLIIDGVNFGCYDATPQQLILSQVEADGYVVTLVR